MIDFHLMWDIDRNCCYDFVLFLLIIGEVDGWVDDGLGIGKRN
jgi:hypothetical protein